MKEQLMAVMIGIDPHKASHTAVALDDSELFLGELRVRSAADQLGRPVGWAAGSVSGRGRSKVPAGSVNLLAQQLVAAGERVADVQPKLAARVRLLATGDSNKNDPNDARSVAVAALRSCDLRVVQAEDHAAVMKMWASVTATWAASTLGSPAGCMPCCATSSLAAWLVRSAQLRPPICSTTWNYGAVAVARHELAGELVADLVRLDVQRREARRRITAAVIASQTTVTEVFGVGAIVAATVIGDVGDMSRFPT